MGYRLWVIEQVIEAFEAVFGLWFLRLWVIGYRLWVIGYGLSNRL